MRQQVRLQRSEPENMWKDLVVHTQAGDVLLTDNPDAGAAFAKAGGCVIGLCPEEALHTVDFPDAVVLAAEEKAEGLIAGDILEKLPAARLRLKTGE